MTIEIVGGSSQNRQISIMCDCSVATARYERDGKITCEVSPLPVSRLVDFLRRHKFLPIPQLIRLVLFLVAGLSFWGRVVFVVFESFCAIMIALVYWAGEAKVSEFQGAQWLVRHPWAPFVFYEALLVFLLMWVRARIARWHGAEHMVIEAYWDGQMTDLCSIRNKSPISEHCGSRFLLLLLLVPPVTWLVTVLGANPIVAILLSLEVGLWLDALGFWNRLAGPAYFFYLIQRHMLTQPPGEIELQTAKRALLELLAAHPKDPASSH